jgi:hypothetical protein
MALPSPNADTTGVKLVKLVGAWLVLALAAGGVAAATTHGVPDMRSPAATVHGPAPAMKAPTLGSADQEATDGSDSSPTGLTGLDNAMAHVKANMAKHPNKGLLNAFQRLLANQAKQQAKRAAQAAKKAAHKANASSPTTHS